MHYLRSNRDIGIDPLGQGLHLGQVPLMQCPGVDRSSRAQRGTTSRVRRGQSDHPLL